MSAEEVDDRRGSFVSAADSFGDQHEIAQRAADEGRRVREEADQALRGVAWKVISEIADYIGTAAEGLRFDFSEAEEPIRELQRALGIDVAKKEKRGLRYRKTLAKSRHEEVFDQAEEITLFQSRSDVTARLLSALAAAEGAGAVSDDADKEAEKKQREYSEKMMERLDGPKDSKGKDDNSTGAQAAASVQDFDLTTIEIVRDHLQIVGAYLVMDVKQWGLLKKIFGFPFSFFTLNLSWLKNKGLAGSFVIVSLFVLGGIFSIYIAVEFYFILAKVAFDTETPDRLRDGHEAMSWAAMKQKEVPGYVRWILRLRSQEEVDEETSKTGQQGRPVRELEDLPKWLGTFVRNTFGMSAVDKMKWYVFIGCTIHMPLSNAITQVWGCKGAYLQWLAWRWSGTPYNSVTGTGEFDPNSKNPFEIEKMQAVCKADWYIPNLGIALVLGSAPIVAFFILGFPIWALIKAYHNRPKVVCINGKSTAFDAAGDEVTFGNAQYREQLASADQLMNPYRTLYASYTQSAWAYKIYILAAKTLIVGSNSLSQTPTIQQLWATGLMGVMGGVTFFTSPYLDRESTTLEWNNRFWTFWLLVSSFITFLPRTGKVLGFVAMGFSLAVLCRGLLEKYWPRAKKIIRRLFPTLKFVSSMDGETATYYEALGTWSTDLHTLSKEVKMFLWHPFWRAAFLQFASATAVQLRKYTLMAKEVGRSRIVEFWHQTKDSRVLMLRRRVVEELEGQDVFWRFTDADGMPREEMGKLWIQPYPFRVMFVADNPTKRPFQVCGVTVKTYGLFGEPLMFDRQVAPVEIDPDHLPKFLELNLSDPYVVALRYYRMMTRAMNRKAVDLSFQGPVPGQALHIDGAFNDRGGFSGSVRWVPQETRVTLQPRVGTVFMFNRRGIPTNTGNGATMDVFSGRHMASDMHVQGGVPAFQGASGKGRRQMKLCFSDQTVVVFQPAFIAFRPFFALGLFLPITRGILRRIWPLVPCDMVAVPKDHPDVLEVLALNYILSKAAPELPGSWKARRAKDRGYNVNPKFVEDAGWGPALLAAQWTQQLRRPKSLIAPLLSMGAVDSLTFRVALALLGLTNWDARKGARYTLPEEVTTALPGAKGRVLQRIGGSSRQDSRATGTDETEGAENGAVVNLAAKSAIEARLRREMASGFHPVMLVAGEQVVPDAADKEKSAAGVGPAYAVIPQTGAEGIHLNMRGDGNALMAKARPMGTWLAGKTGEAGAKLWEMEKGEEDDEGDVGERRKPGKLETKLGVGPQWLKDGSTFLDVLRHNFPVVLQAMNEYDLRVLAYRIHLRDQFVQLNNVLTPAFWFFVFDNNRAPVEFVLEMIRTVEPTAVKEIAAMLDKTGQLQQLVLRQQWALQSPAHAIWFRFWTEMWDSNRDALVWGDDDGHHEEGDQGDKAKKANNASKRRAAIRRKQRELLDPSSPDALCWRILGFTELVKVLREAKLFHAFFLPNLLIRYVGWGVNNDVLTTLYRSMYVAASTCAAHPEARREWEAKHRNDLALKLWLPSKIQSGLSKKEKGAGAAPLALVTQRALLAGPLEIGSTTMPKDARSFLFAPNVGDVVSGSLNFAYDRLSVAERMVSLKEWYLAASESAIESWESVTSLFTGRVAPV